MAESATAQPGLTAGSVSGIVLRGGRAWTASTRGFRDPFDLDRPTLKEQ